MTETGVGSRDELCLPLECPACGRLTPVPWRRLSDATRCACGRSFALGPDGHVCLSINVRVRCPRCLEVIEIPERSALTQLDCPACYLTVSLSRHEPRPKRTVPTAEAAKGGQKRKVDGHGNGQSRWVHVALGSAGVVIVLLAVVSVGRLMASGLEEDLADASRRLMLATIQGETEEVDRWVDPRQRADFRMWVRESVKPVVSGGAIQGGARLRLSVARRERPLTWVKVTLSSANSKDVEFLLAWRRASGDRWCLDASKTARNAERNSPRRGNHRKYDVSF